MFWGSALLCVVWAAKSVELLVRDYRQHYYPVPLDCDIRLSWKEMQAKGLFFAVALGKPIKGSVHLAKEEDFDPETFDSIIKRESTGSSKMLVLAPTGDVLYHLVGEKKGRLADELTIVRGPPGGWRLSAERKGKVFELGSFSSFEHFQLLYSTLRLEPDTVLTITNARTLKVAEYPLIGTFGLEQRANTFSGLVREFPG